MTVATRLRGRGSLLAPDQVSGLAVRLKAEGLGLADNDPVVTWTDSSGNSRSVTQGTPVFRPVYKAGIFGGRAAVRFTAADNDFLQGSAFGPLAQPNTVILVLNLPAYTAGTGSIFFDGRTGSDRHFFYVTDTGAIAINGGAEYYPAGVFPTATPTVLTVLYSGTSSTYRRNGVQYGAGNAGTSALGGLTVGSAYGGFGPSGYDLAELLIYNGALTPGQVTAVERYLGSYYGITVA